MAELMAPALVLCCTHHSPGARHTSPLWAPPSSQSLSTTSTSTQLLALLWVLVTSAPVVALKWLCLSRLLVLHLAVDFPLTHQCLHISRLPCRAISTVEWNCLPLRISIAPIVDTQMLQLQATISQCTWICMVDGLL